MVNHKDGIDVTVHVHGKAFRRFYPFLESYQHNCTDGEEYMKLNEPTIEVLRSFISDRWNEQ